MDDDESPRSLESLSSTVDLNSDEEEDEANEFKLPSTRFKYEENCETDEDESNEFKLPSARLKYEEICETLDNEEKKILELESRRKQLQIDMERLQKEIEFEKLQFNEAMDFEMEKNCEDMNNIAQSSRVDVFNFDKDDIEMQLDDFRQHLEQSRVQNAVKREDDEDIKRFKTNLINYKKGLDIPEKEKITRDKRKQSARLFQKHLKQVKDECSEKIEQLETIQKDIEHFTASGEDEHRQL